MQQASTQLGVFKTAEAVGHGVSADMLERLARKGRLERWHTGVYAVPGFPHTFERRLIAACFALSPSALGSHGSAARIHGFPEVRHSDRLHVLVPRGGGRGNGYAVVHSSKNLQRAERTVVRSIPLTSVARTVCDLASRLDDVRLRRLVHELWRRGATDPSAIAACLDRLGNVRGAARLRRVLAEADPAVQRARSVPEAEAYSAIRAAGLPLPELNYAILDGARLRCVFDLAWPLVRLVFEIDGSAYHSLVPDVSRDDERDAWAAEQGWAIIRVPARMVLRTPAAFVARVRAALRWLGHPGV